MARPAHPDTLFHLEPEDDSTRAAVLRHPRNAPFISTSSEGKPAVEIGYHVCSRPCGGQVLARLGSDTDLILPGKTISKIHIAFEVHPVTHAILISVRTTNRKSVQVSPWGFRQDGEFRQLVLIPGTRYKIVVGDQNYARPFRFSIRWRLDLPAPAVQLAVDGGFKAAEARGRPNYLNTDDPTKLEIGSYYVTRLPSGVVGNCVRFAELGNRLGAGTYGQVYQSIDIDSSLYIAAKVVEPNGEREIQNLHREIKTLQELSHPNIIEFLGYAGFDPTDQDQHRQKVHIYMPLRDGSLRKLRDSDDVDQDQKMAALNNMTYQMLCALDYLSSKGLCHRDVKPDNILFDINEDQTFKFQLADFGLAKHQAHAQTMCGTKIYSAPEVHSGNYGLPTYKQSPKMDVWSLYVTMLTMMPEANFHEETLVHSPYPTTLAFVRHNVAILTPGFSPMARENPDLRASAAQMLVKIYGGKGLTTQRRRVRDIPPEALELTPAITGPSTPTVPATGYDIAQQQSTMPSTSYYYGLAAAPSAESSQLPVRRPVDADMVPSVMAARERELERERERWSNLRSRQGPDPMDIDDL
ncbi:kinase-like domain-containing protein [Lasiosphaeria ovina]|uniref:Kinase-like domain-containing protein n=1 Tax=Lasiosphaeria ovina TaxID=92902 RepID=A0AAE0JTB1_9PEZI|nr:kinase-like domain-containing protein [Lasiosphaeria ovina]